MTSRPVPSDLLLLAGVFFLAALIYSTAGFGGGSAYLAVLTLAGLPMHHVAVIALVCNVIVVSNGTWQFVRHGHLSTALLLPFIVSSVPAAYLAGRLAAADETLRIIAGTALAMAAVAMLVRPMKRTSTETSELSSTRLWGVGLPVGAGLGSLAGLIGIGGGIFLAPTLHLIGWGTAKQIAACASAFILVNALAGLAGKASHVADLALLGTYLPLFIAVFLGGSIGSRLGAGPVSAHALRRITALIVLIAAVNLFLTG
jgi:uncharacterized protein